ncbi:MAG: phytanoyl-CoA dioxygenase [Erythrobacter sp. RIFCSPHIGHO2_12_FULL_63_10]|nr:MAG: phytanoyl-CoA dioxygenase [Erythrobacter sp. RIFCSPHIGHO2_12_FULL_63_10]
MTSAQTKSRWTESLLSDGYCIIPDLLPASVLSELESDLDGQFEQTPFGDGDFYGYRTKRFGRLLRRSPMAERLVLDPVILSLAKEVLGPACDRIQLNVAQAIEIHPGEIEQFPHCDHDMWAGIKGHHEYLLNVMWPITRFTQQNGATRIYPGTHKQQIQSLDELGDPVIAQCNPGSAICFLGSTVHGAGANRSQAVRRAVVIGYSLGWLKPYENLWLAYPPDIAKTFSPELAALAGYAQHRPNLGNFEGQCPSVVLREDVPKFPRATDALRPDQEAAVREFARSQRSAG